MSWVACILNSFQYPTITFTPTALYVLQKLSQNTKSGILLSICFQNCGEFLSLDEFWVFYSYAMPCPKVINWLGKRKQKIFLFLKKAIPINQIISHRNQMKDHSVNDVTVSLYSYSFDLPRRVKRNFMKRSMCGSSLVGTQTIGTRSRTIATYERDFTTVYHLE